MIIDLVKLGEKQIKFDFELKPNEIDLESEFVNLKDEVSFKGKLDNRGARVEIQGEISADVEINCHRCLKAVSHKIENDLETAFITAENYTEDQEIELEIKDLDVSIFEGGKIDLKEIAREQILLALPTQVLCREDCKGLCEQCGANRNLIDCKCEEDEVDPRWSALRKLKIKN